LDTLAKNVGHSIQVQYDQIGLLSANLAKVIKGSHAALEYVVLALLADESILIQDVPGVGKTTLAKALARSVHMDFQRVQCTPDLLPADIFGFSVLNPQDGKFSFRRGPIFTNILLVDEINRASPRTQSALLEAMAEGQVTIEGTQYLLTRPFLVIATQNPVGHRGTFPLPEAQLDRFIMQVSMDYPDANTEAEILLEQQESHPLDALTPVMHLDDVKVCQQWVRKVHVDRSVADYIVAIINKTRSDQRIALGCSPRASLKLFRAIQARAFMNARDFALPDDVQAIAPLVMHHRISLRHTSSSQSRLPIDIIKELVASVPVPVY
jgi:MoxR-like ATPase